MVLTSRFKHLEAKWQWSCIAGVLQEIVALEGCCRGVALQGYFSGVALQRYCRGVVGCRKLLRCIDPPSLLPSLRLLLKESVQDASESLNGWLHSILSFREHSVRQLHLVIALGRLRTYKDDDVFILTLSPCLYSKEEFCNAFLKWYCIVSV